MNIFIDANVYLSFYHLTSDDLEELRKLTELLKKGDVVLHLPEQTLIEYQRNRENKIARALRDLKTQTLSLTYPAMCKEYEEYKDLRKIQKSYEGIHAGLIDKLSADVETHTLKADKVIGDLMAKAHVITTSSEILNCAIQRQRIRNPPGKDNSLGDAINWEALLAAVPGKNDIYLITDDGDFFSPIDNDRPKAFLVQEWESKKQSKAKLYRRLSAFFKEYFPEIKFAEDIEKAHVVQSFIASGTFSSTHLAISRLQKFENFDSDQVNAMIEAALANDQIRWILKDPDVSKFLLKLLDEYPEDINVENAEELLAEFGSEPEDGGDIPF